MQKKDDPIKKQPTLSASMFANSLKYIRFKRYHGIDIKEQSKRNYSAILKRLDERTHLPEAERRLYGSGRLSEEEVSFFRFWHKHIMPLFTARHGTEQFAYIHHSGCLMSVADRRRSDQMHQNSRTGGFARQDYIYFVLGIGAKHPVPVSVANSKTITLHFNTMTDEEKQHYAGMFIGGHESDYQRDITYPIINCGGTQYKVSYNKTNRLRTTTFKRPDGTLITETLSFAEEIIAADPSIDVIFEWLGYKMIEYLRFIGGELQHNILTCNNVDTIATAFHALFPSYRFPELKIPLKKIPITARYVEINNTNEVPYKEMIEFHRACIKHDIRSVEAKINPILANVPDADENTPLSLLLGQHSRNAHSIEVVQLLLNNYADPNANTLFSSNLSKALETDAPELLDLLMYSSASPHCPKMRLLPKVGYIELK